jgi:hypothetical protein
VVWSSQRRAPRGTINAPPFFQILAGRAAPLEPYSNAAQARRSKELDVLTADR